MSTTNLGIIKSEANPLTGTRVQLNTGGWFIAESSAIQKSKIESDKTQIITENGTVEITPSSGKEAMEKVTLTVNVPTTSVTPPEWFTSGKDSVPPAEGVDIIVFADDINSFDGVYGNTLVPDGISTIGELYLARIESTETITSITYIGQVPNGESSPADIFVFVQ